MDNLEEYIFRSGDRRASSRRTIDISINGESRRKSTDRRRNDRRLNTAEPIIDLLLEFTQAYIHRHNL